MGKRQYTILVGIIPHTLADKPATRKVIRGRAAGGAPGAPRLGERSEHKRTNPLVTLHSHDSFNLETLTICGGTKMVVVKTIYCLSGVGEFNSPTHTDKKRLSCGDQIGIV